MSINYKIIRKAFLFIILAELLSIFSWLLPSFGSGAFFIILILALILSLHKLEYGLYVLLAELFIGSHGYLFSFSGISIRIALFLIVMAVWLVKTLKPLNPLKSLKEYKYFWLLGIVVAWAFVWGMIRGNGFGAVFLDFNNWLYFLLILPIFSVGTGRDLSAQKFRQNILSLLIVCTAWLFIKSIILFYLFSHSLAVIMGNTYRWARDTRVGEITSVAPGIYRVFLQSQIYALISFFILLPISNFPASPAGRQFLISNKIQNKKLLNPYSLLLIPFLATIIISFSRSYWVGLVAGLFIYLILLIIQKTRALDILRKFAKVLIIGITSLAVLFLVLYLPPRVPGDFFNFLSTRITSSEAASSSRLNQLKPLAVAIAKHPLIGSGFGTSVTYKSDDPRVVPTTAGGTGEFTTYAFEWGYLDMALKFGLAGLIVYLLFIYQILKRLFSKQKTINNKQEKNTYSLLLTPYSLRTGFGLALIALLVVNIFSPYLNHPLGIGFIILSSLFTYD